MMGVYSKEYLDYLKSNRWQIIRKINKIIWFGRCAFNPLKSSVQVHHLHYHRPFGWEIPLLDTVPVSVESHEVLENPPWKVKILVGNRWISQPQNRKKFNRKLRLIAIFNWFFALLIFVLLGSIFIIRKVWIWIGIKMLHGLYIIFYKD